MITMDQSIINLYAEGLIERDTAIRFARNKEQVLRKL